MEKTHKVCELCGAYTHDLNGEEHHGFVNLEPCPNMSNEGIRKKLIQYFKVFQEHSKRDSDTRSYAQLSINRAKKEREFWKGKYFIIKDENNSLRRKLNNLLKK